VGRRPQQEEAEGCPAPLLIGVPATLCRPLILLTALRVTCHHERPLVESLPLVESRMSLVESLRRSVRHVQSTGHVYWLNPVNRLYRQYHFDLILVRSTIAPRRWVQGRICSRTLPVTAIEQGDFATLGPFEQ